MVPSTKPYHIATSWMRPPGPIVAIDIVRRSCRKAWISSSVILI